MHCIARAFIEIVSSYGKAKGKELSCRVVNIFSEVRHILTQIFKNTKALNFENFYRV
jgi:hypothetical protein